MANEKSIHIKTRDLCGRCLFGKINCATKDNPCNGCPNRIEEPNEYFGRMSFCYCVKINWNTPCDRFKEKEEG